MPGPARRRARSRRRRGARWRSHGPASLRVQEQRTAELRATLRALSPASTLARGYAIAHLADGVIVRDAAQAPASTPIVVTVGRGSFAARSEGEIAEDDTRTDDDVEPNRAGHGAGPAAE